MTPPAVAAPVPQAPPPPPGTRKTSPLVWILVGVLGLFLLGVVGLITAGVFVARNPGIVLGKLITAANPDAEIVSTDMGSQTLRIRDKRTGKEVTVSFDDVKKGRLKFSAMGDDGQVANMEIGGGAGQLPKWVPTYPGATAQANITAKGENSEGMGEGGMVSFTTTDAPSKVMSFYENKCKEMGMNVDLNGATAEGGMIMATEESAKRTLHVMVSNNSGNETTIAVTFGRKR
ncbi:MAG: hypothetical protein JWP63_914 [Candidatus Solibacter sp.]|nr:hypothetical protein [Candidatus Solibacter sp.]